MIALVACRATASRAAEGGPDAGGYAWHDSNGGCAYEPSDVSTLVPHYFFSTSQSIGPIDLGFAFPFYDRTVTQVWLHHGGIVAFTPPPARDLAVPLAIPTVDDLSGFIAPYWQRMTTSAMYTGTGAEGEFVIAYQGWSVPSGGAVIWSLHLRPTGDIVVGYDEVPAADAPFTIGIESFDQLAGLEIVGPTAGANGVTLGAPDPFAICIDAPRLLSCSGAASLACGATTGRSPATLPTNASRYSCSSTTWDGNESTYLLEIPRLSDVHVSVTGTGGRRMGAFLLGACDETTCRAGGGTEIDATTVAPGTLVLVVDAATAADEGAFALTVTCDPIAQPLPCGESRSGDASAEPARLDGHACAPAGADFSAAEGVHEIDVAGGSDLTVTVDSASPLWVFLYDARAPLDPALCLSGGRGGAALRDLPAGPYLAVIDGAAAAAYVVEAQCASRLGCAGAAPIACPARISGTTVGAASAAEIYACADGERYSGPESVHALDVASSGLYSFTLQSADPRLDVILLSDCDEGTCLRIGDETVTARLDPGTYRVVVDGREAAGGAFTLSAICEPALEPASISIVSAPGSCFDEHKTAWIPSGLVQADVLFAIDLTSSMTEARSNLIANIGAIVDELGARIPDVAFGLVALQDYPAVYDYFTECSYWTAYGGPGNEAYVLEQPITTDRATIEDAVAALPPVFDGGDGPEAYSRVLSEAVHDLAIGWRPRSRRVLVQFGDNVPHDCNVASCLGVGSTGKGLDPGRDATERTSDDLELANVVQEMTDAGIALVHFDTSTDPTTGIPARDPSGYSHPEIWDCWARRTGGRSVALLSDGLPPDTLGRSLSELIADVVGDTGRVCSRLELVAEPGYEAWLVTSSPVYSSLRLPASVEFDLRFCVPPGTADGTYDFDVRLICGDEVVATQRVHVVVTTGCAASIARLPEDATTCGEGTTLDASGMTLVNCAGTPTFTWRDDGGRIVGTAPSVTVAPSATTTYTVEVECPADPACAATDRVVVTVEEPPSLSSGVAIDGASCNLGIDVSWDPATFRDASGTGTYSVHRSEISCADAATRSPLATGLRDPRWIDASTASGHAYFYAIFAEDGRAGTACVPAGPVNGGAVSAPLCLGPVTDVEVPGAAPDYLAFRQGALRVEHAGGVLHLDWSRGRALAPGEHAHVLESATGVGDLATANPEGEVGATWSTPAGAARLLLFDVRIADACESLSPDDEPPGWDASR